MRPTTSIDHHSAGGWTNRAGTCPHRRQHLHGHTTISAGTLEIGGAGQLGSGTYAGTISNSGTLDYNSSADQTLSGIISGTGDLEVNGAGTLTLSADNTYTGTLTSTPAPC